MFRIPDSFSSFGSVSFQEMAGRMSGLQASLEQSVASCCRQTMLASLANAEGDRKTKEGQRHLGATSGGWD